MAVVSLSGSATGNSGALSADAVFYVQTGKVSFSTDSGTTKIPFDAGEKVVFTSGRTVTWYNDQPGAAEIRYMLL